MSESTSISLIDFSTDSFRQVEMHYVVVVMVMIFMVIGGMLISLLIMRLMMNGPRPWANNRNRGMIQIKERILQERVAELERTVKNKDKEIKSVTCEIADHKRTIAQLRNGRESDGRMIHQLRVDLTKREDENTLLKVGERRLTKELIGKNHQLNVERHHFFTLLKKKNEQLKEFHLKNKKIKRSERDLYRSSRDTKNSDNLPSSNHNIQPFIGEFGLIKNEVTCERKDIGVQTIVIEPGGICAMSTCVD
jgi:hypothetical protein